MDSGSAADPKHHVQDNEIWLSKIQKRDNEGVNPFISKTKNVSCLGWIKLIIMFPIALVRLILIAVCFLFIWITCAIATCGVSAKPDPETDDLPPLNSCRRCMLWPMRLLLRVVLWLLGFYYIHEKGCCYCGTTAKVIVANHVSFIDPLFLFMKFLPGCAMKAELMNAPVLSSILGSLVPIAVDRTSAQGKSETALKLFLRPFSGDPVTKADWEKIKEEEGKAAASNQVEGVIARTPSKAKRDSRKFAVKRAALKRRVEVADGKEVPYPPVLIFPEGTTSSTNTLLQFKPGAFLSGLPVQPVVMKFPYCNFEATWSCDVGVPWFAWRMLSQVYNCMTVEYLPVYHPSAEEQKDAKLYASNVRNVMAEAMGPDCFKTAHGFDDMRLLAEAKKLYGSNKGIGLTKGVTHETLATFVTGGDFEQIKVMLQQFKEMDEDKNGLISREEFFKYFKLDSEDPYNDTLYKLLDENGDGIQLCEFIRGKILVSDKLSDDQKVDQLFGLYADDNTNLLSRDNFIKMVSSSGLTDEVTPSGQQDASRLTNKVFAEQSSLTLEQFQKVAKTHLPKLLAGLTGLMDMIQQDQDRITRCNLANDAVGTPVPTMSVVI